MRLVAANPKPVRLDGPVVAPGRAPFGALDPRQFQTSHNSEEWRDRGRGDARAVRLRT
jgi:hypothetical protein